MQRSLAFASSSRSGYSRMFTAVRSAMAIAAVTAVSALGSLAPAPAMAKPLFQLPFPCGQVWSGQTRTNHRPQNSIDFNRVNDEGDPVTASAPGRVITVRNLGNTSYGKYVVVDHGGGWTTLYAHLSSFSVSVGQSVGQSQRIGALGNTGGSTGAHLHFEQRYGGSAQRIVFNGVGAYYWGTRSYTSRNGCGGGGGTGSGTVRTNGTPLNVRAAPNTSSAVMGSLANGTRVTIYCQTRGQTITGTYGTSNLWNRIGSGRYIPDVYTYTGSDGQVAPSC